MAEYEEHDPAYGGMEVEGDEMGGLDQSNGHYNEYGASDEQGMDIDDVPVTQEDAWAVIS